jgi:hypothetical protein
MSHNGYVQVRKVIRTKDILPVPVQLLFITDPNPNERKYKKPTGPEIIDLVCLGSH